MPIDSRITTDACTSCSKHHCPVYRFDLGGVIVSLCAHCRGEMVEAIEKIEAEQATCPSLGKCSVCGTNPAKDLEAARKLAEKKGDIH